VASGWRKLTAPSAVTAGATAATGRAAPRPIAVVATRREAPRVARNAPRRGSGARACWTGAKVNPPAAAPVTKVASPDTHCAPSRRKA
jgi:hypothetical protein